MTTTYSKRMTEERFTAYQFDAETRRIVAQREANYRNSGERQIVARWQDEGKTVAEVLVYRGAEYRAYTVRKRSASAFRLAFLVGENGRPLFNDGVVMHKATCARVGVQA